jgi:NADH oxidase (H2O2-forming)
VILATGIRPNVELARKAGLKIGELGGIEVDSLMQSSLGDIYACGDCIESTDLVSGEKVLNLLWHNAKQQADVVAHNCLGDKKQYQGSMNITGVDVFGIKAISLGITSTNISSGKTDKLEIVEKNWGKDYLRLVIYDNYLIGIQSVSRMKDLGLLLGALLRKDELKTYEEAHGGLFPYAWWRYKIAEYCER